MKIKSSWCFLPTSGSTFQILDGSSLLRTLCHPCLALPVRNFAAPAPVVTVVGIEGAFEGGCHPFLDRVRIKEALRKEIGRIRGRSSNRKILVVQARGR